MEVLALSWLDMLSNMTYFLHTPSNFSGEKENLFLYMQE